MAKAYHNPTTIHVALKRRTNTVEKITDLERIAMDGDYIEGMINNRQETKKRRCLRCRNWFVSPSFAVRCCASCRGQNATYSWRAQAGACVDLTPA